MRISGSTPASADGACEPGLGTVEQRANRRLETDHAPSAAQLDQGLSADVPRRPGQGREGTEHELSFGEPHALQFEQVTAEPPHGGGLEACVLLVSQEQTQGQGIAEVQPAKLTSRRQRGECLAPGNGTLEVTVWAPLRIR